MSTVTMQKGHAVGKTQLTKSVVVFGPKGCGKTTYASLIAAALGLTQIIDDGDSRQKFPALGALILTCETPCEGAFNLRTMAFDEAVKLVPVPHWPFPLNAMSISTERPIYHNTKLSTLAQGLTLNRIDTAVRDAIESLCALRKTRLRQANDQRKRQNRAAVLGHNRAAAELLKVWKILDAITEEVELPF